MEIIFYPFFPDWKLSVDKTRTPPMSSKFRNSRTKLNRSEKRPQTSNKNRIDEKDEKFSESVKSDKTEFWLEQETNLNVKKKLLVWAENNAQGTKNWT